MTTKLRRNVARVAAAGLATLVLGGAAAAGAAAAVPDDSSCRENPVARALDVALSVRSALDPDRATTC
jgi:hypothetical protein